MDVIPISVETDWSDVVNRLSAVVGELTKELTIAQARLAAAEAALVSLYSEGDDDGA